MIMQFVLTNATASRQHTILAHKGQVCCAMYTNEQGGSKGEKVIFSLQGRLQPLLMFTKLSDFEK